MMNHHQLLPNAQKPDEFYRAHCRHILTNDKDLEAFQENSRTLLNKITKEENP